MTEQAPTVLRTASASVGQRLLGLMQHYRGAESPLAVPVFYRLRGPLDRDALRTALNALVVRHEALRTTYETTRRRLVQHVREPVPVPLRETQIESPDALESAMRELVRAPFDLMVSPVRAELLTSGPEESVLLLNVHHLSTDGWSGGVMSGDLGEFYRPGQDRATTAPQPPDWSYLDFSEWQRTRFESGALADQQEFWRSRLAGTRAPALGDAPPVAADGPRAPGTELFDLPKQAAQGLQQICKARRTTTFTAALAVFASVMHQYSGDTDFGFASMFANRIRPEVAETVGFLSNLLVLRMTLPERPAFDDALTAAQDIALDALGNQEVPYHLVPQSQGERGPGLENILFQVMAGPEYQLSLKGLEVSQLGPPVGSGSRFDLEFALIPSLTGVQGIVWYDRQRFSAEWVRRLIRDFGDLATRAAEHPDRPVTGADCA
ncbi:condensation domain-containing protein [Streptomyces sp. NPDC050610]|uniref:condensation domain-containing protein n=1 Tax=Streptomyces sp. NPDC050610 TaxID=3157097 RepID=UPI003446BE99